jgi:hypothetical protein
MSRITNTPASGTTTRTVKVAFSAAALSLAALVATSGSLRIAPFGVGWRS